MQKKTWIVGLVALATMGSVYLPLRASADDAGVQDNKQTTIMTGTGNSARQRSSQIRVNNADRINTSSGTVQRNDQGIDVDGRFNDVKQDNEQTSVESGTSRTGRFSRPETCSNRIYGSDCK